MFSFILLGTYVVFNVFVGVTVSAKEETSRAEANLIREADETQEAVAQLTREVAELKELIRELKESRHRT